MGTFKGNKGNLVQHWTLCELLLIANCHHASLNYIDAHSMAPLAAERKDGNPVFGGVQDNRTAGQSAYEKAWASLAPPPSDAYPNSANFVQHLWRGDLSMLLCEKDEGIAAGLEAWVTGLRQSGRLHSGKVHCGDWRDQFRQSLPSPADVGLPGDALTLVSFDPDLVSKSLGRGNKDGRKIYPKDLDTIGEALAKVEGAVVVQMSTYSVNGGNSQKVIAPLVEKHLGVCGFKYVAKTRTGCDMMSLVYARDVGWAEQLNGLGDRFDEWLSHCKP